MSRGSSGEATLLVRVAVAALVGGAIGAAALAAARDVDRPELVAGLVIVVAAGWVLTAATVAPHPRQPAAGRPRPDDRSAGRPFPPRPQGRQPAAGWPGVGASPTSGAGGNGTPAAAPAARWDHAPPPNPATPAQPAAPPMSVAIPVQGGAWWTAAEAGPKPPAAATPARGGPVVPPVELSEYAAVTRVVQCPHCGDFGVDVRQQEPGFAFTCNRCDRHWQWEPGAAWPVAVVRPRRQGRPAPGLRPEPS